MGNFARGEVKCASDPVCANLSGMAASASPLRMYATGEHNVKVSMSIRVAAASTMAAVALGVTAPLASATEAKHEREVATTQAAQQLQQDAGVPKIKTDGLDERLAALPQNRTMEQVVGAMYPGDKQAQTAALQALRGEKKPAGGIAPMSFWGDAWKYTKCVAAVGAA